MDIMIYFDRIVLVFEKESSNSRDNMKEKNFKCEVCDMIFKTKYLFKKHFSTTHDNTNIEISCNICTKTFQTKFI